MGQVTGIFELPTLSTRDKICIIVVSDVRVRVKSRIEIILVRCSGAQGNRFLFEFFCIK